MKSQLRTQRLLDRLLDAATEFFLEKGFDGTSMAEIAKHAHASTETFYRHFPTKEDLFQRVLLRRAQSLNNELQSVLIAQDTPEKALAAFGELGLSLLLTPESLSLYRILMMERRRFPQVAATFYAQGPSRVQAVLATYIEQQIKRGIFRKVEPNVAARQFFDLIVPEFLLSMNIRSDPPPTRSEMDQRVQEAITCFLHGYRSSS